MRSIRCHSASAIWLVLALAPAAAADPITITSGVFTISGFGRGSFRMTSFSVSGDQGFTLSGFQPDGPSQAGFFPP